MPVFRIHRVKDSAFQQFRWAPHASGAAQVRPKDYQADGEIEAAGPYEAWAALRGTERPLRVGDLLEFGSGELRICKYVGFEEASWVVPEPKPAAEPAPAVEASPQGS